jgi:hypothetical protein
MRRKNRQDQMWLNRYLYNMKTITNHLLVSLSLITAGLTLAACAGAPVVIPTPAFEATTVTPAATATAGQPTAMPARTATAASPATAAGPAASPALAPAFEAPRDRSDFYLYDVIYRPMDELPHDRETIVPMVREMFARRATLEAFRRDGAFPAGAMIIMDTYLARVDARGEPILEANGRLIKGRLLFHEIARKGAGDSQAAWQIEVFDPETRGVVQVDKQACMDCHKDATDFVFAWGNINRYVETGSVRRFTCTRTDRVSC